MVLEMSGGSFLWSMLALKTIASTLSSVDGYFVGSDCGHDVDVSSHHSMLTIFFRRQRHLDGENPSARRYYS